MILYGSMGYPMMTTLSSQALVGNVPLKFHVLRVQGGHVTGHVTHCVRVHACV